MSYGEVCRCIATPSEGRLLRFPGRKKGLGAFAERTLVDERISFKIPGNITLAQASTVPLASLTAYLALFSNDCLNINPNIDETNVVGQPILIWGGSCKSADRGQYSSSTADLHHPASVGLYAIQIASLHGLRVITTCSPRHEKLVKSLGAEHVFDYRDADVVSHIRDVAPGLKYFFDTIGNESSTTLGGQALDHESPVMCTVRPGKAHTEGLAANVKVTAVLMWTAFGEACDFRGVHWPVSLG